MMTFWICWRSAMNTACCRHGFATDEDIQVSCLMVMIFLGGTFFETVSVAVFPTFLCVFVPGWVFCIGRLIFFYRPIVLRNDSRFLKCFAKLQCVELSGQQRQRPIIDSSVKNKDVALKSGCSLGDGAPLSPTKAAPRHQLTSGLASS